MADLPPLPQGQPIVQPDFTASLAFTVYWQQLIANLSGILTDIQGQVADIAAALAAATAAQTSATASARELARINSYTSPSNVLSAADVGTDATITVAAHTRVYPVQGAVDVLDVAITAGTVTGRLFSTTYYVYYDDTTLAATSPAFLSTTSLATASVGAAAGRHFIGKVITPADGAAGTSGTGGAPPGGGGGDFIP